MDWKGSPVVTTALSTAVPIGRVPFPAVVFCSKGSPSLIMATSVVRTILDYLATNMNMTFKYSAIQNVYKNIGWIMGAVSFFKENFDPDILN